MPASTRKNCRHEARQSGVVRVNYTYARVRKGHSMQRLVEGDDRLPTTKRALSYGNTARKGHKQ